MMENVKDMLRWVIAFAVVVFLIPVPADAKAPPKLVKIENVEFEESSNEIFQVTIPYIHLAPMHQEIVKKYKDYLVKAIAKDSHTKAGDYHVKRAAMSEEAEKGTYLIYYETIYDKHVCEVSAMTVDSQGNYSIKSSPC